MRPEGSAQHFKSSIRKENVNPELLSKNTFDEWRNNNNSLRWMKTKRISQKQAFIKEMFKEVL